MAVYTKWYFDDGSATFAKLLAAKSIEEALRSKYSNPLTMRK